MFTSRMLKIIHRKQNLLLLQLVKFIIQVTITSTKIGKKKN